MGLFGRIGQVIRANINNLIQEAEDPEKILEQAVMDMQQNLISMRQAVAHAIANQKKLERDIAQNNLASQQWQSRALLALEKGDEELARQALLRRKPYQQTATTLKNQIQQYSEVVNKLKQEIRTLETKIIEAKTKKDMYIARARSAIASKKLYELSQDFSNGTTANAFNKMEEKIFELEAHSEFLNLTPMDSLEDRFAALERSSNNTSKQIEAHTPVIDEELEQLRSQLDDL